MRNLLILNTPKDKNETKAELLCNESGTFFLQKRNFRKGVLQQKVNIFARQAELYFSTCNKRGTFQTLNATKEELCI